MVLLIFGPTHTGKTKLAQRVLEKYGFPYLSIDHLKMGLIRAGYTDLTPTDDDGALTAYLWPVVREMVKTAVENNQNLTVEGCYIPFGWEKDFGAEYLPHIRCVCLAMTERYIRQSFDAILAHASDIEDRREEDLTPEALIADNLRTLEQCRIHGVTPLLIDGSYNVDLELFEKG